MAFRSVGIAYILSEELDYEHDIALRIEAAYNNAKEPSIEEIIQSRKEVVPLVTAEMEKNLGRPIKMEWHPKFLIHAFSYEEKPRDNDSIQIAVLRAAHNVLQENESTLSYYAKRRLELYIEGVRYFAPLVVEQALKGTPQKAPQPSTAAGPRIS